MTTIRGGFLHDMQYDMDILIRHKQTAGFMTGHDYKSTSQANLPIHRTQIIKWAIVFLAFYQPTDGTAQLKQVWSKVVSNQSNWNYVWPGARYGTGDDHIALNVSGTRLGIVLNEGDNPTVLCISTSDGSVLFTNRHIISGAGGGIGFDRENNLYALSREKETNTNGNSFLRKFNQDGAILFTNTINNHNSDAIYMLNVDDSSNVNVFGKNKNQSNGYYSHSAYNYSRTGLLRWQSIINDLDWYYGYACPYTYDRFGNVFMTGKRQTNQGSFDSYDGVVRKLDRNGVQKWQTYIDQNNRMDFIVDVKCDENGDVYVSLDNGNVNRLPYYIAKLDGSNGNILWRKTMNLNGAAKIQLNKNGLLMVLDDESKGFLHALDRSNGNIIWSIKGIVAPSPQMVCDKNGNTYMIPPGNGDSIRVVDISGKNIYADRIKVNGQEANPMSILFDTIDNSVFLSGTIGSATSNQVFVVKYSTSGDCSSQKYNPFLEIVSSTSDSLTLDAGAGYTSYSWNTRDTTRFLRVKRSGNYSVAVTDQKSCVLRDTTYVRLFKARILNKDTSICDQSTIRLDGVSGRYGTVTDQSGNTYETKLFGNQIWTQSNLTTTRYSNGDIIANIRTESDWKSTTNGAWANYQNDSIIGVDFGKIYNGYAVNDSRGLCPTGWRVPSETDWNNLSQFLGGDEMSAGKLKDPAFEFNAKLGGCRQCDNRTGSEFLNAYGFWWSSTSGRATGMSFYSPRLGPFGTYQPFIGFSVRCIKNDTKIGNGLRYQWSTSDTTPSISVSPKKTTTYYLNVTDGILSDIDTVTIYVNELIDFNPFPASFNTGAETQRLDAGSGFSRYRWNTGDTTQAITVRTTGGYRVTVTNSAGCTGTDSVFVQFADTVGIFIPGLNAVCNRTVEVPVKATAFRNILSMQGSVNWNANDLRFETISSFGPGAMNLNAGNFGTTQTSSGALTFSWNDAAGTGQTLADSTTLFTIRFTALGSSVRTVPVTVSSTPTQLEFIDASLKKKPGRTTPGSVNISCEFNIDGRIMTPGDRGVRNTMVSLSGGGSTQTATTDSSGRYSFKTTGGSFTLTPLKPGEQNKANGVTTLDIAMIQSHILQRRTLDDAYKMIAADVDNSSSVSTADILILRRLILATDTTLPNNRLWAFVDADQTFTNIANPFPFNATKTFNNLAANVSHTFRGIKIGDVNYDRNPLLDQAPSGDTLRLFTEWTEADDGSLHLKIRARSISALLGYQSALHWEPSLLQFEGVLANPTDIGIGQRWTDEGHLTLSWNDPQARGLTFTDGLLLLEMRFRKVRPFDRTALRLSGEKIATEAFNANFQSVGVRLQSAELKGASWQGSIRVFPNPAGREVNVEWRQEKKGTATIRLIDAAGRVVYMHADDYPAGVNSRRIEVGSRFQAGGLTVQVEADGVRQVRSLVVESRR